MEETKLSLIIPAHNEAQRLPQTLGLLRDFCAVYPGSSEVLVVENASSDDTLAIAQSWTEAMPSLRVIRLEEAGKGNAIRQGMQAARGQLRVMLDADLSMSVDQVPSLLAALETGADIAIASREAPGAQRVGEPLLRHWVGRVFNFLVRLLVLPGVQDTQCGFKAFKAPAAEAVFSKQSLDGWCFDVEALAIARELGFAVREVPVRWVYKPGSKVRLVRDGWRMLKDLLKIRRRLRGNAYGKNRF